MANPADRVFHTLELAQQIVFELELKDLFRALAITKDLWESKVPDCVWEEHFMRLGYPDYAIRRTSQPLRTCYMCITQAIDAISHEVRPSSTLLNMKNKRKKEHKYIYSRCQEDMAAPLVFQTSSRRFRNNDVFTLDLEELRLLHSQTKTCPDQWTGLVFNGSAVMGTEYKDQYGDGDSVKGEDGNEEDSDADEESDADGDYGYDKTKYGGKKYFVLRRLEDWSLIAKFDLKHSGISKGDRAWNPPRVHGEFIIIFHTICPDGVDQKPKIEIWDRQGSKRGEIVCSTPHFFYDCHSSSGNHYLTINSYVDGPSRIAQTWNLDRVELVSQHTLSDKELYLQVRNGILYKYRYKGRGCPLLVDYWTVDGRPVSKKTSDVLWNYSPLTGRTFSDGTKVLWNDWLTLYTNEGEIVRRFDLKNQVREGCYLEGGILFDRFFFSIFFFEESSCASLVVYSKTGEELTSMLLERRNREYTWFVDIMGRLVIVYEDEKGQMDELEMIDFRGISV